MDDLSFEDKEVMVQVLGVAVPMLTERQKDCLLLQLLGLTQTEAGDVLGVGQSVVARHVLAAMEKVKQIANSYT